jgi:hypothetical protein
VWLRVQYRSHLCRCDNSLTAPLQAQPQRPGICGNRQVDAVCSNPQAPLPKASDRPLSQPRLRGIQTSLGIGHCGICGPHCPGALVPRSVRSVRAWFWPKTASGEGIQAWTPCPETYAGHDRKSTRADRCGDINESWRPPPNGLRLSCGLRGRRQDRPVPFQAAAAGRQLQAQVRQRINGRSAIAQ